jgi:hypothetical protein
VENLVTFVINRSGADLFELAETTLLHFAAQGNARGVDLYSLTLEKSHEAAKQRIQGAWL